MNQISIFCFITWFVIAAGGGTDAVAQQPDFRLAETKQPNSSQLLPALNFPAQTNQHQTNYPGTWPDKKVSFDSQVNSASSAAPPAGNTEPTPDAYGSLVESAGPALIGFKNSIVGKAHGLWGMVANKSGNGTSGTSPNIPKMLSSLAIVLGGYFAFVWITRMLSPNSNSRLPAEVVDVLGRTSFGPKQTLQLVRLGNKLVLLLSGPEGTHPIGDVSDPAEVEHLTLLCGRRKTAYVPRPAATSINRNRILAEATDSAPVPVAHSPLLNNEQVAQSLASVLRTLENTARQNNRTTFEA